MRDGTVVAFIKSSYYVNLRVGAQPGHARSHRSHPPLTTMNQDFFYETGVA